MAAAPLTVEVPVIKRSDLDKKHKIGSGGFGDVWKAFDKARHRDCAVKTPKGTGPNP